MAGNPRHYADAPRAHAAEVPGRVQQAGRRQVQVRAQEAAQARGRRDPRPWSF